MKNAGDARRMTSISDRIGARPGSPQGTLPVAQGRTWLGVAPPRRYRVPGLDAEWPGASVEHDNALSPKGTPMKRIFIIATAVALLLGLGAPAVLAADPLPRTGSVLVSVNQPVTIPAGDHLDTLVVVGGDAQVSGDVSTIVVVRGTATLTGATAGTLVVVNGTADLQAGTTVTGNVRTLDGVVTQQAGATVQGSVRSLDTDLATFFAAFGLLLIPAFILLLIGFGLAMIAAALLVAAFGARQVRETGALLRREPVPVLIAGIAGSVALPLIAILLMATVVGAPIGLALLFVLLPAVAFLAWIVAAIWVGDWIVVRIRGAAEPDRPYRAAVVGVVALSVAGMLPFVTGIATLLGFGALLLAAWRMLRHEQSLLGETSSRAAGRKRSLSGRPQPAVRPNSNTPGATRGVRVGAAEPPRARRPRDHRLPASRAFARSTAGSGECAPVARRASRYPKSVAASRNAATFAQGMSGSSTS